MSAQAQEAAMDGQTFKWWNWWLIVHVEKLKNLGVFEGFWALKIG